MIKHLDNGRMILNDEFSCHTTPENDIIFQPYLLICLRLHSKPCSRHGVIISLAFDNESTIKRTVGNFVVIKVFLQKYFETV